MKHKTQDHYEIEYQQIGKDSGIPAVLIHGLGADHQMWKPQLEELTENGLRLIIPDIRGHGESSAVEKFRIEDCARDISEILDSLKIKKAVIIGVSMGGVIAQQFAFDYPDKTEILIISDSFSEVSSPMERLGAWGQWATIKIAPGLLINSLKTVYKGPDREPVLKYFQSCYNKMDKKQLAKARAALNHFDIKERLKKLNVPTLIMVGDGFGNFAIRMAQKTANAIEGAELNILEGGFDPSNMIVSELFNRQVLSFIAKYKSFR
jgi:3-oxoadipate enol-lactonase